MFFFLNFYTGYIMGIIEGLLKKNVADIKNEKLEIVKVMNKNKIIYEKKS